MSEHSSEAERVDESAVGAGGETSIDADIAASGTDGTDVGATSYDTDSADESVDDSHASDVAAGYDDADDAPVQPSDEEDGTL